MIANLAFSKLCPETAPGPSRSYTVHPKWLHEVDMAARSPYQRSLLLPIPVSRPSYLCALRNLRRQVLDLTAVSSITVTSLLVIGIGRQSGVARAPQKWLIPRVAQYLPYLNERISSNLLCHVTTIDCR